MDEGQHTLPQVQEPGAQEQELQVQFAFPQPPMVMVLMVLSCGGVLVWLISCLLGCLMVVVLMKRQIKS